jgi:hypothetical protein
MPSSNHYYMGRTSPLNDPAFMAFNVLNSQ